MYFFFPIISYYFCLFVGFLTEFFSFTFRSYDLDTSVVGLSIVGRPVPKSGHANIAERRRRLHRRGHHGHGKETI